MKLTSRHDVEAPVTFVFAQLCDFAGWERAAMRRGATVERTDGVEAAGTSWTIGFRYRGKPRRLTLVLASLAAPTSLRFTAHGAGLACVIEIDLIEMAQRRTRIVIKLDLKPRTMLARVFVQSLKLARARVEGRFRTRMAQFATQIESRYARRSPE